MPTRSTVADSAAGFPSPAPAPATAALARHVTRFPGAATVDYRRAKCWCRRPDADRYRLQRIRPCAPTLGRLLTAVALTVRSLPRVGVGIRGPDKCTLRGCNTPPCSAPRVSMMSSAITDERPGAPTSATVHRRPLCALDRPPEPGLQGAPTAGNDYFGANGSAPCDDIRTPRRCPVNPPPPHLPGREPTICPFSATPPAPATWILRLASVTK